jgi:hypothetical protein
MSRSEAGAVCADGPKRKVAYSTMAEAPADSSSPEHDLLEEMHYALRLAGEREQSAKAEIDRTRREFAERFPGLEERARSAEKNANRAELNAASAADRVKKSLQALRVLRSGLTSYAGQAEARGAATGEGNRRGDCKRAER